MKDNFSEKSDNTAVDSKFWLISRKLRKTLNFWFFLTFVLKFGHVIPRYAARFLNMLLIMTKTRSYVEIRGRPISYDRKTPIFVAFWHFRLKLKQLPHCTGYETYEPSTRSNKLDHMSKLAGDSWFITSYGRKTPILGTFWHFRFLDEVDQIRNFQGQIRNQGTKSHRTRYHVTR